MRLHRFQTNIPLGETLLLNDVALLSQLKNVLRYNVGDKIILFNDSSGIDKTYVINEFQKKFVSLTFVHEQPNLLLGLQTKILVLAKIKRENLDLSIRMSVEMGVTDIYILNVERSQKYVLNTDRLNKIIQEATEQSGRGVKPIFHGDISLEQLLSLVCANRFCFGGTRVIDTPNDNEDFDGVIVGPEGGFTVAEEESLFQSGIVPVSLGLVIRRAETAVVNILARHTKTV